MDDRRSGERGFTMIELMIVVAVIAILGAVVVPSFFKENRKSKASSEVGAIFGELAVREEQYKLENNGYLAMATPCPATSVTTGQSPSPCLAVGQPWNTLRVSIEESSIYCSYQIFTGTGAGTTNPGGFTWTSPPTAWFYIIATCDMDGSSTSDSSYFTSSTDATIQKLREGT